MRVTPNRLFVAVWCISLLSAACTVRHTATPTSPTIDSLSPAEIEAGDAGFLLTVNGAGFATDAVVLWAGEVRGTTFVGETQLIAGIGAEDIASPGTVEVMVANPESQGGNSELVQFTVHDASETDNPLPTLTSVAPATLTVGAAEMLVVRGTGFVAGSAVRINGSDRTTTYMDSTQLQTQVLTSDVPTPGTAEIAVFTPAPGGGTSNTLELVVQDPNPLPEALSLAPDSVDAGSADLTLTISGTGFVAGSVAQWNGLDRVTTFVSATELQVSIQASDVALPGEMDVTVYTPPPGGGVSLPASFTVQVPEPVVDALEPAEVLFGGGELSLTVRGSNFVPGSEVLYNSEARVTTYVSDTELSVVLPAGDTALAGLESVNVENPGVSGAGRSALSGGNTQSNTSTLTVTAVPRFAYVASKTDDVIARYRIDTDNRLRFDGLTPTAHGSSPQFIQFDPFRRFAYAYMRGAGSVDVFDIDVDSGELTKTGEVGASTDLWEMNIDPLGRFLYLGTQSPGRVDGYSIDQTDGTLTQEGFFSTGVYMRALTFTPDGDHAFIADDFSNTVTALAVDPTTGSLSQIAAPLDTGNNPVAMRVEPRGHYLYAANSEGNSISVFAIDSDSGLLTAVGSEVSVGDNPFYLDIHPSGLYLYVSHFDGEELHTLAIDPVTGQLSLLDILPTQEAPAAVTVDPSGTTLFQNYGNINLVEVYSLDPTTGLPTLQDLSPTRKAPLRTAVFNGRAHARSTAKYAYVANQGSNNISVFAIDANDGSLSLVETVTTGIEPRSIATTPSGNAVYTAGYDASAVIPPVSDLNAFSADVTTGMLTPTPTTTPPVGLLSSVTVESMGRYAFVVDLLSGVYRYGIDGTTSALTELGMSPTQILPDVVVSDPMSRSIYIASQNHLEAKELDLATGDLSALSLRNLGGLNAALAVDPTARFLFRTNPLGDTVTTVRILHGFEGGGAGMWTLALTGFAAATGSAPWDVATEPSGRYVYVANHDDDTVSRYSMDPLTGELTHLGDTQAGSGPSGIAIAPSGLRAYVTNAVSNDVYVFEIDPVTGALTPSGVPIAAGSGPRAIVITSEPTAE